MFYQTRPIFGIILGSFMQAAVEIEELNACFQILRICFGVWKLGNRRTFFLDPKKRVHAARSEQTSKRLKRLEHRIYEETHTNALNIVCFLSLAQRSVRALYFFPPRQGYLFCRIIPSEWPSVSIHCPFNLQMGGWNQGARDFSHRVASIIA